MKIFRREKTTSPEREVHRLGGRDFLVASERTVGQDLRFMSLIKQAGIDQLVMGEHEGPDAFARRLVDMMIESDTVLDLLSCILIPKEDAPTDRDPGEAWTPDMGRATAVFLFKLKSPADKAKFRSLIVSLVIYFFEHGIASLFVSKTSFQGAIPGDPEGDGNRNPRAMTDTANGPT
jgi:hypothetical protein